jgi:hypothetical protein
MLWVIYKDYFDKSIKTSNYIRYLNWYVWVIFAFTMLLTIGLYIAYIYYNLFWLQFTTYIFGAAGGFYFGNELRKKVKNDVGEFEDVYDNNLITLRQILKKRGIYSNKQIEFLLKQTDEELTDLKVSEGISKQFITIGTVILIPVITMIIKWILEKYNDGFFIIIQITSIIVMVISLFYMLKPLIEQILDVTYWRMKKLRQMIQDINLRDYLK